MTLRSVIKSIANLVPRPATIIDYSRFRLRPSVSPSGIDEKSLKILRELERVGFVVIPDYWSKADADLGVAAIEQIFVDHPQHVSAYSDERIFGAEELSPVIEKFYADPFLQQLSDVYARAETVNVFTLANKVTANKDNKGSGEGWHKDSSFRQFKAFLYLNDVGIDQGPLELLGGSHRIDAYLKDMKSGQLPFRQLRITDQQIDEIIAREPERRTPMVGKAGTLIIADTACIHRGRPPVSGLRYALTNYYVEPHEIVREYIDAYKPVDPEKVLRLGGLPLQSN